MCKDTKNVGIESVPLQSFFRIASNVLCFGGVVKDVNLH